MKFKFKEKKFETLFTLLTVVCLLGSGGRATPTCNNQQVLINEECVDCNALFFGCTQCSFRSDSIESLQCDSCDFEYYLLTVNTQGTSTDIATYPQENQVSMCVEDCTNFAYNFVGSGETGKCEYCGPTCTHCSAQDGCLVDSRWDRGYKKVTGSEYPVGEFPYSSVAPSESFVTTKACADERCDKCQTLDSTPAEQPQCDSCFTYVNKYEEAVQLRLNCDLCRPDSVEHCLACDPDNKDTDLCLSCESGFYLDKSKNQCLACAAEVTEANGCKRCDGTIDGASCQECLPGYFEVTDPITGYITCSQCDLDEFNSAYILEPNRCTQCTNSDPTECKFCDIGFLNSASNPESCELRCDAGQYPHVEYISYRDNENTIESTECRSCDSSCSTCLGEGTDECTSCSDIDNMYLAIGNIPLQTGTCTAKSTIDTSPTFNIFISNSQPTASQAQQLLDLQQTTVGDSVENPLYQIEDGLTRAKELAAQYSTSITVKVTIHMFKGDHYVLERRGSTSLYYQPTLYYGNDNLNYEVTIQPLRCSVATGDVCHDADTVTIYNKRREKFRLDVPVKLTISGIILDSIDSILHYQVTGTALPDCLSERTTCCTADATNSILVNSDSAETSFSCTDSFQLFFASMESDCFANWPRSLFKMRLTNSNDGISSPNQLILTDQAGIKNMYYAMNSVVALTSAGGIIEFSQSVISNLNICGSIVKDSYSELPTPNLEDYVNQDYLSVSQVAKLKTIWGYQDTYGGKTPAQNYMDTATDSTQTSICSALQYCTQISFKSQSTISDIPFGKAVQIQANLVSQSNGLRNLGYVVTLEGASWSSLEVSDSTFSGINAPFDGCAPYDSLVASDETKVQPVGSMNNFRQLFNPASSFNLAQLAGPFIIRGHRGPIVFRGNSIGSNISFQGAISVVQNEGVFWAESNSFSKNTALIGSNVIDLQFGADFIENSTTSKQCGGITIGPNQFVSNLGCENTVGAISVKCVAESSWSYNSITDVYTFDNAVQLPVFTSLSTSTLSTTVTTSSPVQATIVANAVNISDNNFSYNFAGTDAAIVSILGFQSVTYSRNRHERNENWITNSFRLWSALYKQQTDSTTPVAVTTPSQVETRARSMVYVRGVAALTSRSSEYENNFVIDGYSPYTDASSTIQSNGILIEDLVGTIDLSESTFSDNWGILGNNRAGIYPTPQGFSSRLIAFSRCSITQLSFDSVTFENNGGELSLDSPTGAKPQLFSLEHTLFAASYSLPAISNLRVVGNQFRNTGSVATFRLVYVQLSSLVLANNEGDSILRFEYIDDRATVRLSSPYVASNRVYKSAVLSMQEISSGFYLSGYKATGDSGSGIYSFFVENGQFLSNVAYTIASSTDSDGPRTSCVEFSGTSGASWAYVYIGSNTKLSNNIGVLTNEIYADETVAKLELLRIEWYSETNQVSHSKMAQVLYKPPQTTYELKVSSSKFYCTNVSYDADVIMENQITKVQGRPGLFRLGEAQNVAVLPILQKEATFHQEFPDGFLDAELFNILFRANTYEGCNLVEKGGIFYLEEGARVQDLRSDYTECSALAGGLAFVTGHGTYLQIQTPSAYITKMYAYQGGVLYIEKGATVEMTDSVTIKYSHAVEGTVAFVNDRARVIAHNAISIEYNKVFRRGLFSVTDGSQIYIDDSNISNNGVGLDSAVLHAENNRVQYHNIVGSVKDSQDKEAQLRSWIENSKVERNDIEDQGRVFTIIESNITVTSVQFQFNDVTTVNYGIYASYSELHVASCTFLGPTDSYLHYDLSNEEYKDVNGAFLQVQEHSLVWVTDTTFQGGRGVYGGCILMSGYSRLRIEDSHFNLCTAQYGGAIYATQHRSLHIYRSTFDQNFAFIGYGQNIYSSLAAEQLRIEDSSFTSFHNSIYTSGYMFYLKDSTLSQIEQNSSFSPSTPYRADGGGLYIEQTAKVVIQDSVFRGLSGRYGGAIYLYQDRLTTTSLTKGLGYRTLRVYLLTNVIFEDCYAEFDGGAIYVKNPLKMSLRSANFIGNRAERGGGAIDYFCEPTGKEWSIDPDTPCDLEMQYVDFINNQAQIGGAIRWNLMEMQVPDSPQFVRESEENANYGTLRFINNKAEEYGPEIAGKARELIRFNEIDTYQKYYNRTLAQWQELVPEADREAFFNDYIYYNVQSGGDVPTIFLGLMDKYGQIVTVNRGSQINFNVKQPKVPDPDFATEITGVTNFYSAYGTYNMSGMGLITSPGNKIIVDLDVDGVDLQVPSTLNYLQEKFADPDFDENSEYQLQMEMKVRDCVLGEGLRESGACYRCPSGTYLLQAPKVPTDCVPCPQEKAYCLGGRQVGPKPGYWRESNLSYNFWECPARDQCLGMDQSKAFDFPGNEVGLCDTARGYYGVMCTSCLPGFKRSGAVGCSTCEKSELIRIIIMMVGMVIMLCTLITFTLRSAVGDSDSSVFNKILMNHLQMLIITKDFDMDWPPQVEQIFNVAAPLNELTEAIVNFDCFMDGRKIEDIDQYDFQLPEDEPVRVTLQKVYIMAGLPIFLGAVAYVVWVIICRIRRDPGSLRVNFIATLVLLLFLVHPAMTKRMVDVFNCRDYEGTPRLVSDYQIQCYKDPQHIIVSYYVALPCLIIWGLGIPAAVYSLMNKWKDKLTTRDVKRQFGFIYKGYKLNNYYWEIVIMYRKIMCIFVATFLRPYGVIVQALVLLIMLMMFLSANNSARPFNRRQLNDIENMSVATQIITIYCGIFFISAQPRDENFEQNVDFELTDSGKILLVMVIALCNTLFLILWVMKFLEISRDMIRKSSKKLYTCLFLCGRGDKIKNEDVRRAAVAKRETIIRSIEDTVLFLKKMKKIYSNNIFYEDHDRFLRLLYQTRIEQGFIDLTEKRNNYYVQGQMSRQRRYDRNRIEELANDHELDMLDNVVEIMQNQRDDDADEDCRLKDTPFISNLKQLRQEGKKSLKKNVSINTGASSPLRRQRTLRSERTIGPLTAEELESISPDATNRQASFKKLLRLKSLGPRKGSTDTQYGGADPSVRVDDDAESYQDPVESVMAPPALSPAKSAATFVVMHMGLGLHSDAEYDSELSGSQSGRGGSPGKGKGEVGVDGQAPKKEKDKKKKNLIYLENIEFKSRNAESNLIRSDKTNQTVGKLFDRQHQLAKAQQPNALTAALKKQLLEKFDLNKIKKEEENLLYESHVIDYDAIESLDSQDAKVYEMRQLTDRKEQAGRPKEEKKTEGDAAAEGDVTEIKSEGEPVGSEIDSGKEPQVEEEEEVKAPEDEEEVKKEDLGPLDILAALDEGEEDDGGASNYVKLRPRNIPRRALQGSVVVDFFLDKSDSYRTIVEDDEASSPEKGTISSYKSSPDPKVSPDKAGGVPDKSGEPDTLKKSVEIDSPMPVTDDQIITPRQELKPPQQEFLELELSPHAKFSIQMSPSKDGKPSDAVPEKKKSKNRGPKYKQLDHDQLSVPMVDAALGGFFKLPKYRPRAAFLDEDHKTSPSKSEAAEHEEELKPYDGLSSSLHTDSSMRDYDLQNEPEMFNFYLAQGAAKPSTEGIGDGLGVPFKDEDVSEDESRGIKKYNTVSKLDEPIEDYMDNMSDLMGNSRMTVVKMQQLRRLKEAQLAQQEEELKQKRQEEKARLKQQKEEKMNQQQDEVDSPQPDQGKSPEPDPMKQGLHDWQMLFITKGIGMQEDEKE